MSFVSPVTLSSVEGRQTKKNIVVPAWKISNCHNNRSWVRCLKRVQPQPQAVLLVTPWLLVIRYLPWFGMITSSHSNFMKQFNKKQMLQPLAKGVASFSTSCRPGWLSFSHILKTARMTSTHWPQLTELLNFLAHSNNALFNTNGRVIKSKICRPGPTALWAGYAPASNCNNSVAWQSNDTFLTTQLSQQF